MSRRQPDLGRGRAGDREVSTGLARALSKLGFCSRSQAWELIRQGRVLLNGRTETEPERRVFIERDRIQVDRVPVERMAAVYGMLNKPRGFVCTTADERGRPTVMDLLKDEGTGRLFPVGRLDQASEGLLLFTNDNAWADVILSPASRVSKTYHLQIAALPDPALLAQWRTGVHDRGDCLTVRSVEPLRTGIKNGWLEIILEEGKNRHLRRMCEALGIEVLRLVRVAIGSLRLGTLAKGTFRPLTPGEIQSFSGPGVSSTSH